MKNKGFSFIELIAAVAILGIISLPIASSFVLAARIEVKAAVLSKINDAADDVMLMMEESKDWDRNAMQTNCEQCKKRRDDDPIVHLLGCVYSDYLQYKNKSDTYNLTYNGYEVTLKITTCEGLSRVDLAIDHEVNGSTYHVTRKGVLSDDKK